MGNIVFLQSNFIQEILDKNFIQIFGFSSCGKFLQELMFLGFEYSTNFCFSLNLELCKGYKIFDSFIKYRKNSKFSFSLIDNINSYSKSFLTKYLGFKSFEKFFRTYSTL